MNEWKKTKIKDTAIVIIDGDRSSKYPKREEFKKEGVFFLNAACISEYGINLDSVNYISSEKFETIKKGRLKYGDLIMTTRGNGVGDIAYYPFKSKNALINAQMLILRPDPIKLNSKFLYYLLKSSRYKEEFINFSSGSAQPQLPISSLKEIEICFPKIGTQYQIASILSAYDDLIENNLKRIKLLEEIAQRTYEEWFVKFRINGEQLPIDEQTGMPVGWKKRKLKEALVLNYGKSLKSEDRKDGNFEVYGSSGKIGTHNEYLEKGPGIIVGRKGNVGSIFWSFNNFYPIDTVYFVTSSIDYHYLYFNLKRQNFIDSDSAVPGLNRNSAYNLPIIIPKEDVLKRFCDKIKPIFEMIHSLSLSSELLKESRNILLPRLMNGTIKVSGS